MLLLKMPFRRLWGRLFLLMLSHCQILRGVLEFKFDITVKKNIWNVTLEIFGAKYLSVTREEHLNAIYFHQHTFSKLFFFFFLYFCLWKQSSTVGSGMAISVIAKYFWFPVFQHLIGLQFLTHFNLHGAVWIVLVSKLWVGRRHATSSLTFNVKVRHSRTLFPMASVTCHLYFLGLPYQITTEWVA